MNLEFLCSRIKTLTLVAPRRTLLKKIRDALFLIKRTDAEEYRRLFGRLKIIFVTDKAGHTNEFFMPEKIWFANKSLIIENTVEWVASLIIHEAFHATQFKSGRYIRPLAKLEEPALKNQAKFLKKSGRVDLALDLKTAAKHKYWRKMRNDKTGFVYFRNLLALLKRRELILKRAQNL